MRLLRIAVGLVATLGLAARAGIGPAAAQEQPAQIMKVSDLRPGMRGHGLSALEGTAVHRFDVEVLGVLRGWSPQGQVVLIRMSSPLLDQTGTVAGMSGSPVYVEGRLLGAVAYGFWWCKIPLAGVTPIEEMLVARDIDLAPAAPGAGSRKAQHRDALRAKSAALWDDLKRGHRLGRDAIGQALSEMTVPPAMRESHRWGWEDMPEAVRALLPGPQAATMVPLPVPLAVGGISSDHYRAMAPLLRTAGFFPVQAAAAAPGQPGGPRVEPGASVGAVLIAGDMDVSAMGTLTMVEGERVLAFGHPLLGSGDTDLPLAVGTAQAVVPSMLHSFRLSSADRIVGRLTQDRDSALVGRLGEESPMFPCTVNVKGAQQRTFRYRIAGYWRVAPFLTFYATALSAVRWEGEGERVTVRATSRISMKDRAEPLVLENSYATFSPMVPAFELVWMPLEALALNPFREVQFSGVDVDIQVDRGLRVAAIEAVRVGEREVRPGQTLRLWVTLKEFQGEQHVMKVELEVPRDAQPGTTADIVVCDAAGALAAEMSADPGFFQPRDFDALLAAIRHMPRSTHLYVHGTFLKRGLRYRGQALPQLPSSVTNILSFGTESGVVSPLAEDVKLSVQTPWVVQGIVLASVLVRDTRELGKLAY